MEAKYVEAIEQLIVQKFDELRSLAKPFLTVEELASYLGVKTSYVYKMEKPGRRDPRGRGRLTTGAEIRQTPNKQNKNDPCRNSCRQGIFM